MTIREAKKLLRMYPPVMVVPAAMMRTREEHEQVFIAVNKFAEKLYPEPYRKMLVTTSDQVDVVELHYQTQAEPAIKKLQLHGFLPDQK